VILFKNQEKVNCEWGSGRCDGWGKNDLAATPTKSQGGFLYDLKISD
jgi:hypothetical protein